MKERIVGNFTEEIILANNQDRVRVEVGVLEEVRQVTVRAVVDTGATTIIINEATRQELGLAIVGKKTTAFANGTREECGLTEPVNVYWKDRDCSCRAVVVPEAKITLLGAIPLEDMDLMVDPVHGRLIRTHGNSWEQLALSAQAAAQAVA